MNQHSKKSGRRDDSQNHQVREHQAEQNQQDGVRPRPITLTQKFEYRVATTTPSESNDFLTSICWTMQRRRIKQLNAWARATFPATRAD